MTTALEQPDVAHKRSTAIWVTIALLAFAMSAASLLYQEPRSWRLISIPTLFILTAVFRLSTTYSFTRIFPLLALIYVVVTLDYLRDGLHIPRGDSHLFQIHSFFQIAEVFAQGEGFSEWIPTAGGTRTGFSHIHLGIATPHRLLGYLLYGITPLSVVVAYKIAFAIGVILISFGWGLCLERLTRSTLGASLGALAIMLGGTGTAFHQEQVLFTTAYMPWLLLALIEIKHDRRWIIVFVALLGLGATNHFPQILAISLILVVLVTLLAFPRSVKDRLFLPHRGQVFASLLLFSAAILPLVYIAANMGDLRGWYRPSNLVATSYADYLTMWGGQYSLSDMIQYIKPKLLLLQDGLDVTGFYVGEVTILFAFVAILFSFRAAWPIALLALIAALLTTGKNSPIDVVWLLYHIAPPVIGSFRQWYHFFPVANFSLAALAAIGIAWCALWVDKMRDCGYSKLSYVLAGIVLAGIFVLGICQLAHTVLHYSRGHYMLEHKNRVTRDTFLKYEHAPSLLQYRTRLILDREEATALDKNVSPQEINNPRTFFIASTVKYGIESADDQISTYLASAPANNIAVIGAAPSDYPEIGDGVRSAAPNLKFQLRAHGIDIETESAKPGLLVTPMNYDLGIDATLNGTAVPALRVNGALAGIPIQAGKSVISLRVKHDSYLWIFYLHALVQLIVAIMIVYLIRAARNPFTIQPPSTNKSCLAT